jgi:hypothetical protein
VRLLYFGSGVPEAYGVDRERVAPEDWLVAPRPGDYVISAQFLVMGLWRAEAQGAGSDWLRRYVPEDVLGGSLYLYRFGGEGGARDEEATGPAPLEPDPSEPSR